jgi:hypothetical protein
MSWKLMTEDFGPTVKSKASTKFIERTAKAPNTGKDLSLTRAEV